MDFRACAQETAYGECVCTIPIPCTRSLQPSEVPIDYERATGDVIVETFATLDPKAIPGVLVALLTPLVSLSDRV